MILNEKVCICKILFFLPDRKCIVVWKNYIRDHYQDATSTSIGLNSSRGIIRLKRFTAIA